MCGRQHTGPKNPVRVSEPASDTMSGRTGLTRAPGAIGTFIAGRVDLDSPHNGGKYELRSHDVEELRVTPHIPTFYS